jgi:PKD repeat protein
MGTYDQNWHIWEVQRISSAQVTYFKDSFTQNLIQAIPDGSLPVGISAYHTIQVVDWVLVRDIVSPEPVPANWGQREENTLPLSASFTVEPSNGTAPLEVTFRDTSTGTGITQWNWNFGDGDTGSGSAVTHRYTTAGTRTVTLTITNSTGSSSNSTGQVIINPPPPFYDDFASRKSFSISSPGGLVTNYPVQVTLHRTTGTDSGQNVYLGTGVTSTFSDIRFTTTSNIPLSYWVESVAGDTATVWVKVSSIPTTGTQLYLYYGKSSAVSESNGANVFGFFDDFSGSSLNNTWSVVSLDTTPVVSGGSVTVRQNGYAWGGITSTSTFGLSKAVRMKAQYKSIDGSSYGGGGFTSIYGNGISQGAEIETMGGNSHIPISYRSTTVKSVGSAMGTYDQNWHIWEVQRISSAQVTYFKDSFTQNLSQAIPDGSLPVGISAYHTIQVVDWVLVRDIVSPEPNIFKWENF